MSIGQMKVDKYYDIGCEECGSHLSTDFSRGMAPSRIIAVKWALQEKFNVVDGKTLCPHCIRKLVEKNNAVL